MVTCRHSAHDLAGQESGLPTGRRRRRSEPVAAIQPYLCRRSRNNACSPNKFASRGNRRHGARRPASSAASQRSTAYPSAAHRSKKSWIVHGWMFGVSVPHPAPRRGHRHPPAPQQLPAHLPMTEIRETHHRPRSDAQHLRQHLARPLHRLQRAREHHVVERIVRIVPTNRSPHRRASPATHAPPPASPAPCRSRSRARRSPWW